MLSFLFAILFLYTINARVSLGNGLKRDNFKQLVQQDASDYIIEGEYDNEISAMTVAKWNKYCRVDEEWFERNEAAFANTDNYSAFLGVFVKLPGATTDRNLTYVADIPYTIVTRYEETPCEYNFNLQWYVVCDATLCPLIAPGLYLAVQETANKINVNEELRDDESRYLQNYKTPVIPGNPDQTQWLDLHISLQKHWFIGLYSDASGAVTYEELISIDIPHKHISHSAQSYTPGAQFDSSFVFMNPWIDLDYYDVTNGVLPEPAKSVYEAYMTNPESLYTEYATGKFSYMALIVPASKRSESEKRFTNEYTLPEEDYDRIHAAAIIAQERGIYPKSPM